MNGPSFLEKTCLVGILKKKRDLSFPTLKQLSSYMHTTKSRGGIVYYERQFSWEHRFAMEWVITHMGASKLVVGHFRWREGCCWLKLTVQWQLLSYGHLFVYYSWLTNWVWLLKLRRYQATMGPKTSWNRHFQNIHNFQLLKIKMISNVH